LKTEKVRLKNSPYNIVVGSGIIRLLGKELKKTGIAGDAYIISNRRIYLRFAGQIRESLKSAGFETGHSLVPDAETSKSFKTAQTLIGNISSFDKKRRLFIIALGGGVIGDLAGFVASIYKRGIPYIQVPTTLLAQVDSSIGGKTGVDLSQGKNLLGAFYQPRLVFSEINFLKSLPLRQVRSGLAEIIKYGAIKDPRLFGYLEKHYSEILALKQSALEFVVWRCSGIKARIVEQDEKEKKGIRTILNFGHTLGHAIEAAGAYGKYNHGEAIALGMLLAADISKELNILTPQKHARLETLIGASGLPTRIKNIPLAGIVKAQFYDKKFSGKKNKFVLLQDIGKTRIMENVPLEMIRKVTRSRIT